MFRYEELRHKTRSTFRKVYTNEFGEIISERTASFPLIEIDYSGFRYLVLYDDSMQVESKVFEYLNYDLYDRPLATRRRAAHALRSIFCFLSLNNYELEKITEPILAEMKSFFRGIGFSIDSENPIKPRSNSTINGYFTYLRGFCESQRIDCPALFKPGIYRSYSAGDTAALSNPYRANLKTQRRDASIPKYISPQQFEALLKLIRENKDYQAEIIIRLMYSYGLRLGEVLGLTTEDVIEKHANNKLVPFIIIRNRLSDKPYQYAKNLPHVASVNQYGSKDYTDANWKVPLTYDMYDALVRAVNNMHEAMQDEYPSNYETTTADIVSQRNAPEENHYLFLNRYGKVLSDQTWNNYLKKLFHLADIPIDHDSRKNNLSHRFRHGFAMWHAHFSPKPIDCLQLSKMMRHRSIHSCQAYFNLSEEDQHQLIEELQSELYANIPGLAEWSPLEIDTFQKVME